MRLDKAFTLGLGSLALGLGSLAAACVGTKGNCGPRQAVNNGASGTITVTAPAAAKKGDFAVIWIRNFREEPSTCNPSPDDDWTHFWPVGVYVD